jgi:hypothetical protein
VATSNDQLQAMRHLAANWDGYGAAAPESSVVDLAQEFTALIEAMVAKSSCGPSLLHLSPTRTGGILIEWEGGDMQHELEINPDGSIGFLHLNKKTGHTETRKFSPGTPVGLLQELRLLAA